MTKNFTYVYLDCLPKIPQEYLVDFELYVDRQSLLARFDNTPGGLRKIIDKPNATYERYQLKSDLQTWLEFNICRDALHHSMAYHFSESYPIDHAPHVDFRDFVLIYLLHAGGDHVITSFYQQKDQPLEREIGCRTIDYGALTEIDSVKIQPHRWILLNGRIVHGIKNINGPRTAVQIGLNQENKFIR